MRGKNFLILIEDFLVLELPVDGSARVVGVAEGLRGVRPRLFLCLGLLHADLFKAVRVQLACRVGSRRSQGALRGAGLHCFANLGLY